MNTQWACIHKYTHPVWNMKRHYMYFVTLILINVCSNCFECMKNKRVTVNLTEKTTLIMEHTTMHIYATDKPPGQNVCSVVSTDGMSRPYIT
jgi:hypothetical protein